MSPTRRTGSPRVAACRALLAAAVMVASPVASASTLLSEDVPVPGGTAALAKAIGLEPVPDLARFAAELARVVYDDTKERRKYGNSKFQKLLAYFESEDRSASSLNRGESLPVEAPIERVPIPLPAVVWSEVLRRPVAPARLFAAVMSDAAAALLLHGLAALDDETLQFFVDHPAVARQLYVRGTPAFATFAAHLQIHGSRVVVPGGDGAASLWEALLGEKTGQPGRFIRQLFIKGDGRLAYLYDVVGSLDSARASFALGLWIPDVRTRLERFIALGSAVDSIAPEWSVDQFPFRRPPYDLVSMLLRVQPESTGAPSAPAERTLWARVFDVADQGGERNTRTMVQRGGPIDSAWLVQALLHGNGPSRSDLLDQFAFGQRALTVTGSRDVPDVLHVLRAFPRFRMLMLTLERIGVRQPSVYAALVRQAERLSDVENMRAHAALAGFQGAIALVERLTRVRTIELGTAEKLLEALAAVPSKEGVGFQGALVPWMQAHIRPALGKGEGGLDDLLLEALAGLPHAASTEPVSWEGQQYRLDLVTAERQRLRLGTARDGSHSIDVAMTLYGLAHRLATDDTAWTDIQAALVPLRQRTTWPSAARQTVEKAIENLSPTRPLPGASRRVQVAESVLDLVDVELGEALLALSYQINLHVPRGAAGTAAIVAGRHDFGLARSNHDARVRTAWAAPTRITESGTPWRLEGAALGLDLAIPSLALRRIDTALPLRPRGINELERDTLATSVVLMDPCRLRNDDLEAIAQAMARGRRRIEALIDGDGDATAMAREIGMDGWRARALQWTLRHEPQRVSSWFSETDLLYLGGGAPIDLHAWAMSAVPVIGCLCARWTVPGLWTALVGRPQPGLLVVTVADLNLRVAAALAEMRLPAALAKWVLSFAVQDFIDRASLLHADDWLTRVRAARALPRERIEDYIAAAAVDGPLVAETSAETHRAP
jgi:hypothetical protein